MDLLNKIKSLSLWHFVWIAIILSEGLTALLTSVVALVLWGHISIELIIVGIIDSFVVSLIVVAILIYFVKEVRKDESIKIRLRQLVDDLKISKKQLQQGEAKYRDLFENANDAIFLLDNNFKYIDLNH